MQTEQYSFHPSSKPVGRWWLVPQVDGKNGLCFELYGKPKRRTRVLMRLVFGWVWEDIHHAN